MRVPASPHNLRKFVAPQSDSESSDCEVTKPPPRPNKNEFISTRGRDRTRISAVQRLVERRMAQKEKEREKERDLLFRRSSSVGSAKFELDNDKYHLTRSLSRDRLNQDNKTYIKISSNACIEEKKVNKKSEEILKKYCSPLKSTELFKDITTTAASNANEKNEANEKEGSSGRKISFTTEKTILINNSAPAAEDVKNVPKIRKVSIDINYVYEQHHSRMKSGEIIQNENVEPAKRRASLEKRFQERQSSTLNSSSASDGSSSSNSSTSTPEPMPRQSKHRKISSGYTRNINIILEDEISNETSESSRRFNSSGLNLPKPKTSFHRRFSQDHTSMMSSNVPRAASPVRKISLQNNSTINTDSLADQKKEEGNQLYLAKNYKEALQRYNEAISLCPGCPAFYGNRAACHMMLGQFVQALEDARTSVILDPSFVRGYVRVAKCCVALGEIQAARQAINTAIDLNTDASATFDLERMSLDFLDKHDANLKVAFDQKDYRKALYHIEQALKIASASQRLKLSRAECLAFLGRYQEAQDMANDILRSDSTNVEAIYIRGLCLYQEDNIDKAFSHFQQVLKLAPDHSKAKEAFKRARTLKTKKDEGNEAFKACRYEEAISLYTEALAVDADNKITNAKLYCNRAHASAKLKKWSQSVDDCGLALGLDPTYAKAYLRRAKSLMELGQFEEAIRDYESLHKSDRSNFEYRQLLNQAKLELKKSKRKDYYSILGVDKNANEEEIKKAYKKRALEHHPDRHVGASEEEKQEQEKKFKEVGEAYGILSEPRKRAQYDAGNDLDHNVSNYDTHHGFSSSAHHMDAAQIFKAFFGGSPGFGHAHYHHFGFGTNGHHQPGSFFGFS